uniref:hypothetical protein n=1 Tax=Mycolicibacterium baixiangningiae TaxID=2761578 RepID=UPI001D001AF3
PGGAGEGQFSGPPPWGPPPQQPQWGGPPSGPPPPNGGKGKWIIGGVIVLLVVALAVTVTILVTRDGSDGNSPTPPGDGQASEFASANDTGPVNIITEDPTCDAWLRIAREYTDVLSVLGWKNRNESIGANAWTPEQRSMYESAKTAMTRAAEQTSSLVRLTPHRAVRELYEQFMAYTARFVDLIPTYTVDDDNYLAVSDATQSSMVNICEAIQFRSAAQVAPLVSAPEPPEDPSRPATTAQSELFLAEANDICPEWDRSAVDFDRAIASWRSTDPRVPATDWTPDQRAVNEAVAPVMERNADKAEQLGRDSNNPVLEDFATLSAQYRRAFVAAIPAYSQNDNFVAEAASDLGRSITFACRAAS